MTVGRGVGQGHKAVPYLQPLQHRLAVVIDLASASSLWCVPHVFPLDGDRCPVWV